MTGSTDLPLGVCRSASSIAFAPARHVGQYAPMSDADAATAIRTAMADGQGGVIDQILEPCDLATLPVGLLNELLVSVIHHQHQRVARALQLARDPSTVPYAASALGLGFSHLAYTASDDEVIAKWYSWLLADIGTPEAIALLRQYLSSENEQIAEAMTYRLSRLERHGEN